MTLTRYEATEDPAPLLRFLAGRSALQAVRASPLRRDLA